MWIARDKDGELYLFTFVKPVRIEEDNENYWIKDEYCGDLADCIRLDDKLFPDLKWEDEPVEVNLITLKKKR